MIRCCVRLIGQGCTKHVSIGNLTVSFTESTKNLYNNKKVLCNLHYSCQLSSVATPPIAQNDIAIPCVISITEAVQHLGFNENDIKRAIEKQPELIKSSSNKWLIVVEPLIEYQFGIDNVLTILERYPEILNLKKDELVENLFVWLKCGMKPELVVDLLTTHPHFLQVNASFVAKRIKQYQLLFESKNRVGKLLMIAPNLLQESVAVLTEKLNYLNELCTDNSNIAASGVLVYSALHIKARHEFLIRAGVYKRPNKDFRKELSKNPRLVRIVNTSDKEFAVNVAGLSLFEYNVFLEMFEKELGNEYNYDPEEDDDDEGDESHKLNYAPHQMRNRIKRHRKYCCVFFF